LLAQQSTENKEFVIIFRKTNATLVALELKAIDAAKNNDRKTAIAIINSDEYIKNKTDYMSAITHFTSALESRSQPKKVDNKQLLLTNEEQHWIA